MGDLWGLDGLFGKEACDYDKLLLSQLELVERVNGVFSDLFGVYLLLDIRTNTYVGVSENVTGAWGYAKDEILGGGFKFISGLIATDEWRLVKHAVWPDLINYVQQNVKQEDRINCTFQLNYRLKHKNGTYIYLQETQKPIWVGAEGQLILGRSHFMEVKCA